MTRKPTTDPNLIAETFCRRCGVAVTIRQNPTNTTRPDIIARIHASIADGTFWCEDVGCGRRAAALPEPVELMPR